MRSLIDRARLLEELPNLTPDLIRTYPGLAWIKEYHPTHRNYTVVILSEAYITKLLGPKVIHYVGKTDFDFWPEDIARIFYANDEQARTHEPAWCEERFSSPLTGEKGTFEGFKWSFTSQGKTFVAGAGRGVFDNE